MSAADAGSGPRRRLTRDESRRQTRKRLVAAARELFSKQGVNGTSVEQIAEYAGYSRGAFYGNFADKHELVAELLTERTVREIEEVGALAENGERYEALRAWNLERAEHVGDWMALRLELLLYVLRNPDRTQMLIEREKLARRAHEAALGRAFADAGIEPPAPLRFLSLITHALEDGLLIQRMLDPEEIAGDVVVDAVELLVATWLKSTAG